MLKLSEIKKFIDDDRASSKKQKSKIGVKYYEARHDIEDYQIFYINDAGEAVVDEYRSNIKISHPFFTELIDQCAQYMLSGKDRFVTSSNQELQKLLDPYFDDEFKMQLNDLITHVKIEGDSYLYRYVDEDFKTRFRFADGLNVVEVPAKYSSDGKDYVIYYYVDRVEKEKTIINIEVSDSEKIYFYELCDGSITKSKKQKPRYHVQYKENDKDYYDTFDDVPFLRMDNNKKRTSDLFVIKDIIDDYDLMACGLSNNLQDVAEGIYVVKGWDGQNLDELTHNIRVKKQVGVGEGGDLDIKTIQVPYQARVTKMAEDEKNIYRFGMGFNTAQMGDGNVTNVVIRSRYALLDLKCNKLEMQLKRLMRKIIKIVIDEINREHDTEFSVNDVEVEFKREIMTNALDNAQMEQIKAQTAQVEISTLLAVAQTLDNETVVKEICNVLDINYDDIKAKLPKPQTEEQELESAMAELNGMMASE